MKPEFAMAWNIMTKQSRLEDEDCFATLTIADKNFAFSADTSRTLREASNDQ